MSTYANIRIVITTVGPVTFTHHGTKGQPTLIVGTSGEGRPIRTVFIPGAQLKAVIRHADAIARLSAHGGKLSDAYRLALGQSTTADKEDDGKKPVRLHDLAKRRQDDHNLDLFGAWKTPSRLFVSHLIPDAPIEPDRLSVMRRDFHAYPDIMDTLSDQEQSAFDERATLQLHKSTIKQEIEEIERTLRNKRGEPLDDGKRADLQSKLEKLQSDFKTISEDDSSNQTNHLAEVQSIPAGTQLLGIIRVNRLRDGDLDIIRRGLESLNKCPYWGAQRTRGFGLIKGTATYLNEDGDVLALQRFGACDKPSFEITALGEESWANLSHA